MPEPEPKPENRARARALAAAARWTLRFLGWSLFAAMAGMVVSLLVGVIVYFNRVALVNEALATYVQPFEVKVGAIDFLPLGTVSISDLHLHPKRADIDTPLLSVPSVSLTYGFEELRQTRRFRSVLFQSPRVELSEATLRALQETRRESPSPSDSTLDLEDFSFFTDNLAFRDGHLAVDLIKAPAFSAKWNVEVNSPAFTEEDWLEQPIRWKFESVALGDDGQWGAFDRIEGEVSLRKDLGAVHFPSLQIPSSSITVSPEWFGAGKTSLRELPLAPPPTADVGSAGSFSLWIDSLSLGRTELTLEGFDAPGQVPTLPEVRFSTSIQLDGITFEGGRWDSESPLKLELGDVSIGREEEQLAFSEVILLEADSLGALLREKQVEKLELIALDLVLTEDTWEPVRRSFPTTPAGGGEAEETPAWKVGSIEIMDGSLLAESFILEGSVIPQVESRFQVELHDLLVGGRKGLRSGALQEVVLHQSRLWPPGVSRGETPPLVSWERADLVLRWDDFAFDNEVERVLLHAPAIHFTDESLGDWIEPRLPSPENPGPLKQPVYRVQELTATDGRILADSSFAERKVPKIDADFSMETILREDKVEPLYLATLENLQLRNHAVLLEDLGPPAADLPRSLTSGGDIPVAGSPVAGSPVAGSPVNEEKVLQVEEVKILATAMGIQHTREIEEVSISGATLVVGDGLKAAVDRATPTPEPGEKADPDDPVTVEPQAESTQDPPWAIKKLEVAESRVLFESLIPQIEGLEFDINTVLNDVPLSPEGLLAQEQLQKVELSNIEIRDPYDSFITVASLPTIFVEFSLAGLLREEIDRIDLINPSLFVGQGLFWWIDYQRNFRKQNEGASVGLADVDALHDAPDWTIRQLEATAGKIVIAPTGIPIGVVPFPFHAETSMQNGEIELTLNIPDDEDHVYRFPDYKVEFSGLTGDVQFNVPVKSENNNLVQKFFLDRLIWKNYEAEDLYLVVTFDENGIYGELGGNAYSGYVTAGFNFYLDNPGKWDAWIAGTDFSTTLITEILAPQNFRMEGPISIEVVSEGFKKQLGETTAEIQTTGPGWFDVTKLDAILDNFPEDWTGWQESLANLSLIALKRFDYDKGAGSLYLLGRDGLLSLRFVGPYGTRELNLHLHDNRNRTVGNETDREPIDADPSSDPEDAGGPLLN